MDWSLLIGSPVLLQYFLFTTTFIHTPLLLGDLPKDFLPLVNFVALCIVKDIMLFFVGTVGIIRGHIIATFLIHALLKLTFFCKNRFSDVLTNVGGEIIIFGSRLILFYLSCSIKTAGFTCIRRSRKTVGMIFPQIGHRIVDFPIPGLRIW